MSTHLAPDGKAQEYAIDFTYKEFYIPPRCRKTRCREATASANVSIPIVAPSAAPIAFRHSQDYCERQHVREYRLYKDKLYIRSRLESYVCREYGWLTFERFQRLHLFHPDYVRDENFHIVTSVEDGARAMQRKFDRFLILDNGEMEVWETIGEPRYEVATFGLGHNHASTNYFIENSYNPNVSKDMYFNALQHDEAVQYALKVAAGRGDTNSFSSIQHGPVIEVLMPEAVHCDPKVEAGEGEPFLNHLHALTQAANSAEEAAILAICSIGNF